MSGETEAHVSAWGTDTLKEYLESLLAAADLRYQQRFESQEQNLATAITAQEKAIGAALSSAERAVAKAENATEKRFEGVNEFRGALEDRDRLNMPRAEAESRLIAISEKTDNNSARIDRLEGARGGSAATIGVVVGAAGVLVAIVAVVIAVVVH